MRDWRLVTADIAYRMPDHPVILQSFIWQDYDLAPEFPGLLKFLRFWSEHLDGPIHSVRMAHVRLIDPRELRHVGHELRLH